MDKKKRQTWLDLFRREDNTVIYDQLGIKESFNEFFEGILQMENSREIQNYYRISLHLILFLTIQKEIREEAEKNEQVSSIDMQITKMHAQDIFWKVTRNIPKTFMFTKVPHLTKCEEKKDNIKEILYSLVRAREAQSEFFQVYTNILLRSLQGSINFFPGMFKEDGFNLRNMPRIFKMLVPLKHNKIIEEFYIKYETVYFLNVYCTERALCTKSLFAEEDVNFFPIGKVPEKESVLPPQDSVSEYEIKVTDRKFVIILHKCAMEFSKKMEFSKGIESIFLAVIRTFLIKENILGFFADYSAEALLVSFSYIAVQLKKKRVYLQQIYSIYQNMGFVTSFYLIRSRFLTVTIEDIISLVVHTYNRLLPVILRNTNRGIPRATIRTSPYMDSPIRQDKPGGKYILSPLSGRMSQIVPLDTFSSRKVLFKDGN